MTETFKEQLKTARRKLALIDWFLENQHLLKVWRSGVSQQQFAKEACVQQYYVSCIENGDPQGMSLEALLRMQNLYMELDEYARGIAETGNPDSASDGLAK
jgi:hypothetical protein